MPLSDSMPGSAPGADPVLPAPPNKPEPFECCERGCSPCIFDYYWDALARWEEAVRELGRDPDEVLAELGRKR